MKALPFLLLCLFLKLTATWADDYFPDVLELDGTNGLSFPADFSLSLGGGATLEFWVAPEWEKEPDYEPVILSNTGEQGPSYLVAIRPDKKGVVVHAGEQRMEAGFDFTDGRMHFVAIVDLGDTVYILVDNMLVAGGTMHFAALPS